MFISTVFHVLSGYPWCEVGPIFVARCLNDGKFYIRSKKNMIACAVSVEILARNCTVRFHVYFNALRLTSKIKFLSVRVKGVHRFGFSD